MTRTREENTRYMAEYRAGLRAVEAATIKSADPAVPDLDTRMTVEESIRKELDLIPGVGKRPGKVAALLALGRVLDDAGQKRVHPAAVNQLRAGLDELWAAADKKPTSRLEVLRERARTGT